MKIQDLKYLKVIPLSVINEIVRAQGLEMPEGFNLPTSGSHSISVTQLQRANSCIKRECGFNSITEIIDEIIIKMRENQGICARSQNTLM